MDGPHRKKSDVEIRIDRSSSSLTVPDNMSFRRISFYTPANAIVEDTECTLNAKQTVHTSKRLNMKLKMYGVRQERVVI